MPHMQVLLSAYNGEKYIAEQLDSLLGQTYSRVTVLIRDDGSTDGTWNILKDYSSRFPDRIRLIRGSNRGVIRSFFHLLVHADAEADYYAFCDQDDVWLPAKAERAAALLERENPAVPAMVFTATRIADADLRPLRVWPDKLAREPSFYNALVQNVAVGTTVTLNRAARNLLVRKLPDSDEILMHDWWAYLVVSAFGRVIFDPEPTVLYRQHGGNVVGGEASWREILVKKWKSFHRHRGRRLLYKQAKQFYNLYGEELQGEKKEQLELFLSDRDSLLKRIRFLSATKLYRQSKLEQALFRFLILIGHI